MPYKGIRLLYPNIQKINKRLACYIQLMRPFTLVAPLIAGLIGILIERAYHGAWGEWTLLDLLLAPLAIALFQAFGQIINQVTDVAIDEINKSYRALPRKLIKTEEAIYLAVLLASFAFWFSFRRSVMFGLLMTGAFICAVAYSVEPIRIKKRSAWGSLLLMSFSRGFLPFIATWSVYGNIFTDILPWQMGIVGFCWVLAFQGTKDFPDVYGDYMNDIPTLPTIYGNIWAFNLTMVLSPFAIIAGIVMWFGEVPWMYITLPMILPALFILFSLKKDIETEKLENSIAWIGFYTGLGFLYVLFLLAVLI